jgi:hypothetical protein
MSPSGLVNIRSVKPDPGAVVTVVTIFALTSRSDALVVVTTEELLVPVPPAPLAISKGLDGAIPLYSRIRISA